MNQQVVDEQTKAIKSAILRETVNCEHDEMVKICDNIRNLLDEIEEQSEVESQEEIGGIAIDNIFSLPSPDDEEPDLRTPEIPF